MTTTPSPSTRLPKRGDRVTTSGSGRTAAWGKYTGTVVRRRGTAVFVAWDRTSFEDEMSLEEVTHAV